MLELAWCVDINLALLGEQCSDGFVLLSYVCAMHNYKLMGSWFGS